MLKVGVHNVRGPTFVNAKVCDDPVNSAPSKVIFHAGTRFKREVDLRLEVVAWIMLTCGRTC